MIASIRGKILEKQPTRVVIEVGGLGLDVHVPLPTGRELGNPGDEAFLHTVLVVREDALTLFGFHSTDSRELFLKLTSVSGIGPKIALNALSGPSIQELVAALTKEDLAALTRLPGIGKKTAQRMVVDLKDGLVGFSQGEDIPEEDRSIADAVGALVSLGYGRTAATEAVRKAAKGGETSVETLVRAALTALSGRG